jgi:ribonuclease T2
MEQVMRIFAFIFSLFALSGGAFAQANQCAIPAALPEAQSETAPEGVAHNSPLTGYVLAASWSPQFCKSHPGPDQALQCGGNKFGFILHGLWPEGTSRDGLQWCKPVGVLPAALVRQTFCSTPSVKLQQHEWAKHGSCMTDDPARYFRSGATLFNALKWPDMNRLSRAQPSLSSFTKALVAANPGMREEMFVIITGQGGWLQEVKLCLGTDLHPRNCPRYMKGARPETRLKIWRAEK